MSGEILRQQWNDAGDRYGTTSPEDQKCWGGALTWVLEVATVDVYGRLFGDGGGRRSRWQHLKYQQS